MKKISLGQIAAVLVILPVWMFVAEPENTNKTTRIEPAAKPAETMAKINKPSPEAIFMPKINLLSLSERAIYIAAIAKIPGLKKGLADKSGMITFPAYREAENILIDASDGISGQELDQIRLSAQYKLYLEKSIAISTITDAATISGIPNMVASLKNGISAFKIYWYPSMWDQDPDTAKSFTIDPTDGISPEELENIRLVAAQQIGFYHPEFSSDLSKAANLYDYLLEQCGVAYLGKTPAIKDNASISQNYLFQ